MHIITKDRIKIAAGLTAFIALVSFNPTHAHATPGQYTNGGNITITVAAEAGRCATVFYPQGGTDVFCGQKTFKQYGLTPGYKFGANVVSYSGNSVFCKIVDDSTGDIVKMDYGYAGGSANCMANSVY